MATDMLELHQHRLLEQRRTPRYCCTGEAEIRCLPFDGFLLPGKLRNLGLGGCYIETVHPFLFGAQAEILLRVNASSFRTMGLVKAIHNRSGVSMQFVRMSSGGHSILEELLFEMARLRVAMSASRPLRQRERSGGAGESRNMLLNANVPIVGTVLPADPNEDVRILERRTKVADLAVITRILDLFA